MFVSIDYKRCSDCLHMLYCFLLNTRKQIHLLQVNEIIFFLQMTGDIAVKLFSTSAI
jgi:hypothetical protein